MIHNMIELSLMLLLAGEVFGKADIRFVIMTSVFYLAATIRYNRKDGNDKQIN